MDMNGYCKDDGDQLFFLLMKDQTAGGELKGSKRIAYVGQKEELYSMSEN